MTTSLAAPPTTIKWVIKCGQPDGRVIGPDLTGPIIGFEKLTVYSF